MRFARRNQSKAILLVAWLLSLACFYPSEGVAQASREKNELKGRVRAVVAYEILFLEQSGRVVEQTPKKYVAVTFNRQGRMIREATYSTPADRTLSLADTPLA